MAVFTKIKPDHVEYGTGHKMKATMKEECSSSISAISRLINAYFPSGTSGDERQDFKYQWLDEFSPINKLKENINSFLLGL